MTKLEEAARALYGTDSNRAWEDLHPSSRKPFYLAVKRMLIAIREPDDEFDERWLDCLEWWSDDGHDREGRAALWRWAIDILLSEEIP